MAADPTTCVGQALGQSPVPSRPIAPPFVTLLTPELRAGETTDEKDLKFSAEGVAELRRTCSAIGVSIIVHMALILTLGLLVASEAPRGIAFTIVFSTSPDELPEDVEFVTITDEPLDPHLPTTQADGFDTLVGAESEAALQEVLDIPQEEMFTAVSSFDDVLAFDAPSQAELLQDFGKGEAGDGIEEAGLGARVSFYGVEAVGKRFVFVADCSGSMNGPPLERLKQRLRAAIAGLPPSVEFYIVFFNDRAIPMPSPKSVTATPQSVHKYLKWAEQVQGGGGTDPSQALQIALALHPSAVFLLTDGVFQPEPTQAAIENHNSRRAAQIHTIAIGDRGAEPVLRKIAQENKGTYQFVPR